MPRLCFLLYFLNMDAGPWRVLPKTFLSFLAKLHSPVYSGIWLKTDEKKREVVCSAAHAEVIRGYLFSMMCPAFWTLEAPSK